MYFLIVDIFSDIIMATVHSFPVRQQQQNPSTMYISPDAFNAHFGFVFVENKNNWLLFVFRMRSNVNKMFAWCNELRRVYSYIVFLCVCYLFWLPIMNGDPTSLSSQTNNSLTEVQLRRLAFTSEYLWSFHMKEIFDPMNFINPRCLIILFEERCTLSSSISIEDTSRYISMQLVVLLLCACCYLSVMVCIYFYLHFSRNELMTSYRWFCWCRKMFFCLVIGSLCNQLASVLGCRPIDVIYDIRYIFMFIVQTIGFFICLLWTFFLGVKYASVKF